MKSPLELEASWTRERLLTEAAAERLARLVPRTQKRRLRARAAYALYALADWLSSDPQQRFETA